MKVLILVVMIALLASFGCTDCPPCNCVCEPCEACPLQETCPSCPDSISCPSCPAPSTDTVTIYRYVCTDGAVVRESEDCFPKQVAPVAPLLIKEATISPACIYGKSGGTIYFEMDSIARNISFLARSGEDEFVSVYETQNLFSGRREFMLVSQGETGWYGDFRLLKDKVYTFKISFYFPSFNLTQETEEFTIDTTPTGDYGIKKC